MFGKESLQVGLGLLLLLDVIQGDTSVHQFKEMVLFKILLF